MRIFQMIGLAMIATMLIVYLNHSEAKVYGLLIRLIVVIGFLLLMINDLQKIFSLLNELALKMNMDQSYFAILLKVIGVAYLAELGYQLCKDAGEEAIGTKVQLAAKIMIFVIASPVILALMALITDLV